MGMRKQYEDNKSLRNERWFAEEVGKWFGVTLHKLPKQYGLDFIAKKKGSVYAFLELKNRTCTKNQYGTYIISLSKYLKAKLIYQFLGARTLLCVKWTDQSGSVCLSDLESDQLDISIGGRYDRDDWQDVEPLINIDISNFNVIGEKH